MSSTTSSDDLVPMQIIVDYSARSYFGAHILRSELADIVEKVIDLRSGRPEDKRRLTIQAEVVALLEERDIPQHWCPDPCDDLVDVEGVAIPLDDHSLNQPLLGAIHEIAELIADIRDPERTRWRPTVGQLDIWGGIVS